MLAQQADYVIIGNAIFTSCSDSLLDGFIAVKGNKIVAVGERGEAKDWIGPDTTVYEFDDQLIMPGFIDSHVHTLYGGYSSIPSV